VLGANRENFLDERQNMQQTQNILASSQNVSLANVAQQGGGNNSSSGGGRFLLIKDLEPNQKNVNLQVIVLDIAKPTQTKDGHEVRTVRIADKSGSINLSVWNDYGSVLREGDILRLNGCFTQIWKNSLQVKVGGKGQIIKCGDFMMIFSELPDMSVLSSEMLKDISEQQGANKQPPTSAPGQSSAWAKK
jgi:ssDNA-binding replication factor A large subunit